MRMTEINEDFLKWLAGYFDHGGLCVAEYRDYDHYVAGHRYRYTILHVRVKLTGIEEILSEVKRELGLQGATIRKRESGNFLLDIAAKPDILKFAYLLIPYVRIRKADLEHVIRAIEDWTEKNLSRNPRQWKLKEAIYKILDIQSEFRNRWRRKVTVNVSGN